MPIYLEEGVFCTYAEYDKRSSKRVREIGGLAVGSVYTAMFSLQGAGAEAAKLPVEIVEAVRPWRHLFVVTFDICDDDMVPEVRTTERFNNDAFMRPSNTVVIRERGRRQPVYDIMAAYLLEPRAEPDAIDEYLAQALTAPQV